MLGLIFVFLIILAALAVLLYVFTTWFQGYIYSEPAGELYWRTPAAAAGLTVFFAFWSFLEYRNPERFDTIFNFSVSDEKRFPEFTAIKGDEKTQYRESKNAQGHVVYFDQDRHGPKTHPDAIVVKDGDREVEFKPERDAKGKFLIEQGRSLRYLDDRGRVMTEDSLGLLATRRWGWFFVNVAVNLLHLGVWFLVLWLLCRFQWMHALGLATVFWLLVTLTMLPMLFARVRDLAAQRAVKTAATASLHGSAATPVAIMTLIEDCATNATPSPVVRALARVDSPRAKARTTGVPLW